MDWNGLVGPRQVPLGGQGKVLAAAVKGGGMIQRPLHGEAPVRGLQVALYRDAQGKKPAKREKLSIGNKIVWKISLLLNALLGLSGWMNWNKIRVAFLLSLGQRVNGASPPFRNGVSSYRSGAVAF